MVESKILKRFINQLRFKHMSLSHMFMILIIVILLVLFYKYFFVLKETFTSSSPIRGYYKLTWINSNPPPTPKWDLGIWFGGETPIKAIDININNASKLTADKKILNLGGGTETGVWYGQADFDYINGKLSTIKKAGWDGLCFDVEVCTPNIDLIKPFADCFAKCKAAGLMVIVTMSHLVPWGCVAGPGQGMNLVNSWIKDPNVDYISPQLYTEGTALETTDLSVFKDVPNKILPSIPYESDWAKLTTNNIGITPAGYIIWNAQPPPPTRNYCGVDWSTANSKCGAQCPKGQDSECPDKQHCFADLQRCPINK
jgi:hypothetical protein